MKRLTLFLLALTVASQGWGQVQMDRIAPAAVNNWIYVSRWCNGSTDLGVCINNATSSSKFIGPQTLYLDSTAPATITTAPNVPMGWKVISAPVTYTLNTTWIMNHRNTTFDFQGAQFNYTKDSSSAAFFLGKNCTGTVNTSGTTITSASGCNFSTVDPGDEIFIAGSSYNIASVQSSTQLTVTATAGTQTGASDAIYINQNVDSYWTPISVSNVTVHYSGAGTTASSGFQLQFIAHPLLYNTAVIGMSNQSYAYLLQGVLDGQFIKTKANVYLYGYFLDQFVAGGVTISSNKNKFDTWLANAGVAPGYACVVQNNAFGNQFINGDIEGNRGKIACVVQTGSMDNLFQENDFEQNGDGTTGSEDISNIGPDNIFIGNTFQSAQANFPASGILCGGASGGSNMTAIANRWVGPYTTAYNYISGCTGMTAMNNVAGAAFGDPPTAFPSSGNAKLASLTITGSGFNTLGETTVGSLPSAASNPGAMILVTDSTAVASEGQTCVGSSTNKAVAVSNGSIWKCF